MLLAWQIQHFCAKYLIIFSKHNQRKWKKNLLKHLAKVLFGSHFDCQDTLFPSKILQEES
jgi:hypothetical protein